MTKRVFGITERLKTLEWTSPSVTIKRTLSRIIARRKKQKEKADWLTAVIVVSTE